MAALSFSIISTATMPKVASSNPQGQSRDAKYHVLIRSAGVSSFNSNARKGFNTRTHQRVKSMSGLHLEDSSNAEQEKRENKSFGSMCIDDDITRIKMLFLEIKRRHSSLSANDAVPLTYPVNMILGLSMVNHLESLGIARHFKREIKEVLDDIYRFWIENGMVEGMPSASDIMTISISFRILRWNGYDVSPDIFLSYLSDSDSFPPSLENDGQATIALLNLYKASQMMFPGERILEEAKSFSQNYLKNITMGDQSRVPKGIETEIKRALDVPWMASLERIEHLRYMKAFGFDDVWIGTTSSRIPFTGKDLFLSLAKKDYNICQAAQQEDLKLLEKWSVDSKLGDLQFARQKLVASYFSAASTLFSPEMSTTRIVWTKNAVLTVLMDDFYDVDGSIEDIQSFVEAVRRWDPTVIFNCSDNVKILFSAIYNTVNDIAQDVLIFQGWDISTQLREIWYELAISMMKEAEWTKTGFIPSLQEYIDNGKITIGLEPIVFTSLFFVGPKLSEQTIRHHEYKRLLQLMNTCGRLLNDIQSYKREIKQGKLNYVSLFVKEYPGKSVEDATEWIRLAVNENMQKLLRKLLQPSELPRECKQTFWNMIKIIQLFYLHSDEFTSPTAILEHMQAVLFNPVL